MQRRAEEKVYVSSNGLTTERETMRINCFSSLASVPPANTRQSRYRGAMASRTDSRRAKASAGVRYTQTYSP